MDALKKLKVVELKQILKDNGLRVGGTKADLIARILENNIIYENDIKISPVYIQKGKMKWSAYTVAELKKALKDFGLPVSGTKKMLVKRLEDEGLDDVIASDYYAQEIKKVAPVKQKSVKPINYIPLVETLQQLEPVNKGIVINRPKVVTPVKKPEPKPAKPSTPKEVTKKITNVKNHKLYKSYTMYDMKQFLSEFNLPTDGLKEDLAARLIEYFKNRPTQIFNVLGKLRIDINSRKIPTPKDKSYRTYHYDNLTMHIKDLQKISKEYGLSTSGSKDQLIDRIIEYELKNNIIRTKPAYVDW